jgi:hypothetical protein
MYEYTILIGPLSSRVPEPQPALKSNVDFTIKLL